MPYCSSCGAPIPEGQGRSCSYCYGDPDYGSDGYLRDIMETDARNAAEAEAQSQAETEAREEET